MFPRVAERHWGVDLHGSITKLGPTEGVIERVGCHLKSHHEGPCEAPMSCPRSFWLHTPAPAGFVSADGTRGMALFLLNTPIVIRGAQFTEWTSTSNSPLLFLCRKHGGYLCLDTLVMLNWSQRPSSCPSCFTSLNSSWMQAVVLTNRLDGFIVYFSPPCVSTWFFSACFDLLGTSGCPHMLVKFKLFCVIHRNKWAGTVRQTYLKASPGSSLLMCQQGWIPLRCLLHVRAFHLQAVCDVAGWTSFSTSSTSAPLFTAVEKHTSASHPSLISSL